jgi:acetolactate synthase-1/2/3 large subunit
MFFQKRYASTEMVNPDFVKIARGYKIAAESISERKDLKDSLMRMLDARGPYLLEIKIDEEANVLPMIEPGASVSEITLTYK